MAKVEPRLVTACPSSLAPAARKAAMLSVVPKYGHLSVLTIQWDTAEVRSMPPATMAHEGLRPSSLAMRESMRPADCPG